MKNTIAILLTLAMMLICLSAVVSSQVEPEAQRLIRKYDIKFPDSEDILNDINAVKLPDEDKRMLNEKISTIPCIKCRDYASSATWKYNEKARLYIYLKCVYRNISKSYVSRCNQYYLDRSCNIFSVNLVRI